MSSEERTHKFSLGELLQEAPNLRGFSLPVRLSITLIIYPFGDGLDLKIFLSLQRV